MMCKEKWSEFYVENQEGSVICGIQCKTNMWTLFFKDYSEFLRWQQQISSPSEYGDLGNCSGHRPT